MRKSILTVSLIFILCIFPPVCYTQEFNHIFDVFCAEVNQLLSERGFSERNKFDINELDLKRAVDIFSLQVVNKIKESGYPVGLYMLDRKEDIIKVPVFMTIFEENVVVAKKTKGEIMITTGQDSFLLAADEFLTRWNNTHIISPFVTGVWLNYLPDSGKTEYVHIIYSYHTGSANDLIKEAEKIINENRSRKIIYVDELGLIPEESVSAYKDRLGINEEEAFNRIKQQLTEETSKIEKGTPVYDANETYYALYSFLAQKRIKCILEDLKYANWKSIILFDNMGFDNLASIYFVSGDVNSYIKLKKAYCLGFWKYNIKDREDNFAEQLESLLSSKEENAVFTIRGIVHFGLEKRLQEKSFGVKFIIIGEGILEDNLINQQIIQVYLNQGIVIPDDIMGEMLLASNVEDLLRLYLFNKGNKDTLFLTHQVRKIMKGISIDYLYQIPIEIKKAMEDGVISGQNSVPEFIYKLVTERIKQ